MATRSQPKLKVAKAAWLAALAGALAATASLAQELRYSVPLFGAAEAERQGFVRIVNRSATAGGATVYAIDDAGARRGPVTLDFAPRQALHFNSDDLQRGNADKGVAGVGAPGTGDWRLEITSELDLQVLAYLRTRPGGFLTSMHDVAPEADGAHRIAILDPGGGAAPRGRLRLVNAGEEAAAVVIRGVDDAGRAGAADIRLALPGGQARTIDAQALEEGDADLFQGALGDGGGMWRLTVSADQPIQAMSLLDAEDPRLRTNLSTAPANAETSGGATTHRVPLFPPKSHAAWDGVLRLVNRLRRGVSVRITAVDDEGAGRGPVTLTIPDGATTHLDSTDLEDGNAAKGLSGGVGDGDGNWRLALRADGDIDVLAYVRTGDRFLTGMHDLAPAAADGRRVAIFNPASNANQRSMLRLINDNDQDAAVTITGVDDSGAAGAGAARIVVPANAARHYSATSLESGAGGSGVAGALGAGRGKWRLTVESDRPVGVMSLLESPGGHLTNLSTGGVTPPNRPPVVTVPAELEVAEGAVLGVAASATDPDGSIASWRWEQVSGPAFDLRQTDTPDLIARAPLVEVDETAEFRVTVTDDRGGTAAAVLRVLVRDSAGGEKVREVGERFRDCPECPEMVVVPAGTFMMGGPASDPQSLSSERPVHEVTIGAPFAVGVYEVTFDEWNACVADGGCGGYRPADRGWGRGSRPVIQVSWEEAQSYVRWLSEKTGESYRLLSESEWEYAARAGTDTRYSWGDEIGDNRANCFNCGSQWDGRSTAPVGSFAANAWGLHDMHGNVVEWTEDCWNGSYEGAPSDGSAWLSGSCSERILRGGSWSLLASFLRASNRDRFGSGNRLVSDGFRVAQTLAR